MSPSCIFRTGRQEALLPLQRGDIFRRGQKGSAGDPKNKMIIDLAQEPFLLDALAKWIPVPQVRV